MERYSVSLGARQKFGDFGPRGHVAGPHPGVAPDLGQRESVLGSVGQHAAHQMLELRTEFLGAGCLPSFSFIFSMFKFKKSTNHHGDEVPHLF